MAESEATPDSTVKTEVSEEEPKGKVEEVEEPKTDRERLKKAGLDDAVIDAVMPSLEDGTVVYESLEERTIKILKELPADVAEKVIKAFRETELYAVTSKTAFFGSFIKIAKERLSTDGESAILATPIYVSPDMEKLKAFLARTNYPLEVSIGQRKLGGPPPDTEERSDASKDGCECYIGKIPHGIYEYDIFPFMEECGKVYDLRIMMDPVTFQNKGYAFATFFTKEEAQAFAKKYDEHEIMSGRKIKVNVSIANTRIFVGNIPKQKSKDEILEEFKKFGENIEDVIVYEPVDDPEKKNRGFCFVQFKAHKDAAAVKRQLLQRKARPFGREVVVDWADPQREVDPDIASKVKVLYVKNLTAEQTEDKLKEVFGAYGEVESVKRIRDYGFVHFAERENALKAKESLNGTVIEGNDKAIEVTVANPPVDKRQRDTQRRDRERRQLGQMRGFMRGGWGGYPRGPVRGRGAGGPPWAMRGGGWQGYGYGAPPMYAGYGGMGGYGDYYSSPDYYADGYGYEYGYGTDYGTPAYPGMAGGWGWGDMPQAHPMGPMMGFGRGRGRGNRPRGELKRKQNEGNNSSAKRAATEQSESTPAATSNGAASQDFTAD